MRKTRKTRRRKNAYTYHSILKRIDKLRLSTLFIFNLVASAIMTKWLISKSLEPLYDASNVLYCMYLIFSTTFLIVCMYKVANDEELSMLFELVIFIMILVSFATVVIVL